MNDYHDHRPTSILKKTQEIGAKWNELDSKLVKLEENFKFNIQKYMELIWHLQEVVDSHKL